MSVASTKTERPSTRDVPGALACYRDALGLEYPFEAGARAFLLCGAVLIMLPTPESAELPDENLHGLMSEVR